MSEEKYRIRVEQLQPDGTWEKHKDIQASGYVLLAGINDGNGLDGAVMNLRGEDIALMLSHFTTLRRIILQNLPVLAMAEGMALNEGEEADGDPGEEIDVEKLLTCVEKTADGKNADTAVLDEAPAPARKKGWLRRLFKK